MGRMALLVSPSTTCSKKHPVQKTVDLSAFLECEELSPLEHVDIIAAHIDVVAGRLFGSASPSGTISEQWRAFMLHYETASPRLREALAASTHRHANNVENVPLGCHQWIEAEAMAPATGLDAAECM